MEPSTLQKVVVDALEDIKAKDIEVIDTSRLTALFDRIVIASADSNRQTRALARNVQEKVKETGGEVVSVEGEETGEWVLVDLGDVVVHIMQPAIRSYYNLEELWAHNPPTPARRKAGAAAD
jgi:ribosome-associated protein